jgi:mannose-1-phosphate guanylyltransferase/phosphomannomutase
MAGGFGTRLRPLTSNIPKPMAPMLGKPIIEHIINHLKLHGITELILILYHQSEIIRNYFKDGSSFGVKISYVKPDADYGTAGAVHAAKDLVKDRFIIISGDVVTNFDITKAIAFHEKKKSLATIVLTHTKNPLQFGIVLTNKEGRITTFYEKPTWSEVFSDTINTGIYVLEKSVLDIIPEALTEGKQDIDFSKDVFPYILKNSMPLYGYTDDGYWRDIGSLDDYINTNVEALKGRIKLPGTSELIKNGNLISKTAKISKNAVITNSVIGSGCKVGDGTEIKNSVLWDDAVVEKNCRLSGDVLCSGVIVRSGTKIGANVFIGDEVKVGNKVTIRPGVKIWPKKIIDGGATVLRNVVWEDRWKDSLFTDSRITGFSNIEITPEFAAKIGTLFGIFNGTGSRIDISRDTDNVSRMIKGAIISGLMSSGINVIDLQTIPIPVLRQELRAGKGAGGIFVRKSPFDSSKCDIIFFDNTGKDLSTVKTKSIERLFFSESHRPVPFHEIGSVTYPERTYESYKEHFISNINREAINKRGFKLVINYSHGITSSIFPLILGDFNLELVSLDTHLDSTRQTRSPEEFQAALEKLSYIVTSLKYDAGFLIDAGGEKVFTVDNTGKIISHDRFLSMVISLYLQLFPGTKKIAVPIQATGEIDMIAGRYGTEIIRVKDSHYAMMNATETPGVSLVGGTKGGIIFPEFSHATDGMFSIVKVLEMLAVSGKKLSQIDKETPSLFMTKNNIPCTREQKGIIMRRLVEDTEERERLLIDGIKIFSGEDGNEWVLCIPDSEREIFHVNAEAKTKKAAEKLVKEFTKKIKKYQKSL